MYDQSKHWKICVEVNPVQQQHGGVDCSQLAIAFATELAHGKNPVGVSYAQSAMRDHFLLSLENKKVEPFSRARKPAIRNIVSIALYCVRKLPEAANMVLRNLADGCMSISQSHCKDTPTHSLHCKYMYSSDH